MMRAQGLVRRGEEAPKSTVVTAVLGGEQKRRNQEGKMDLL